MKLSEFLEKYGDCELQPFQERILRQIERYGKVPTIMISTILHRGMNCPQPDYIVIDDPVRDLEPLFPERNKAAEVFELTAKDIEPPDYPVKNVEPKKNRGYDHSKFSRKNSNKS